MRGKVTSAAGAILFVGLIRAEDAPYWALAALAVGLYEVGQMVCRIIEEDERKQESARNRMFRKRDARKWAEEWFNPYKEVRG